MTDSPQSAAAIDVAALAAVAAMFRLALGNLLFVVEPAWGKSVGTVLQGIIVAALMWLGSVVVQTSNATIRLEAGMIGMKESLGQKNDRDLNQDADITGLIKIATANAAAIATQFAESERLRNRVDNLEGVDSAAYRRRPYCCPSP